MSDTGEFERLLEQADALARANAWEEVLPLLRRAREMQPDHAGVLTGIGTSLVQLGRPAEALELFRRVIELAPQSPEAHNNLGVTLSLTDDPTGAEAAYRAALDCDNTNLPAWKNLAAVLVRQNRLLEGMQILAAIAQAHPADVESVTLIAHLYEEGGERSSAEAMYAEALKRQPDHAEASAGLARVRQAIDAEEIARQEHAKKLASLKSLRPDVARRRVVFYAAGGVSDGVRAVVPVEGLTARGWTAQVSRQWTAADVDIYDAFVFLRPHLLPSGLQQMEACQAAGKRVVIDLDDDFHHMPPDHPGYAAQGGGNPAGLRALEQAIGLADTLTLTTAELEEIYRPFAKSTAVLPNCWSKSNPLWERPAQPRQNVHIGWAGTAAHRPDVAAEKAEIVRTLRGDRGCVLVIGGDRGVFDMFGMLPDAQRAFIEMVRYADYPTMLAQFDILIAPLRDIPFNRAKSDSKLLEAGVRRIPWVASGVPAYRAWSSGGILVKRAADWHEALATLIADPRLRKSLGEEGRAKAEEREISRWVEKWEAVLSS
jgi:cytochrome c-type biogenesis protein CcmH/NrfG/glycosyltransferase involved in cell wall biosynthesis